MILYLFAKIDSTLQAVKENAEKPSQGVHWASEIGEFSVYDAEFSG